MNKRLFVLLFCLFVVNIGFGITLPVLPFYAERLALAEGASTNTVGLHVGLLTGIYALMQLLFAPVWGVWSDRVGRKPLLLLGIAGYGATQVLFGAASDLWLLYAARIVGGALSSAALPAAAAYVSDETTAENRNRGMAWLGTAASLGVVVGPALGGTLARREWHFSASWGHFVVDSFSVPFFAAAVLAFLVLFVAAKWLPESLGIKVISIVEPERPGWRELANRLRPLLILAFIGQFGLALFEAIIALFAGARFDYGPAEVGAIFLVCGLVMGIFQSLLMTGYFTERISEIFRIVIGFVLMGISLASLGIAKNFSTVIGLVGALALGMAMIAPNLSALISKRAGSANTGAALGVQSVANSLGQFIGPVLGGVLFGWNVGIPFFLTGLLLVVTGLVVVWASGSAGSDGYSRAGEKEI